MFADQVNRMNVGQKLLEAPVPQLIESLAKSIAKAQFELDATSVRIATRLAEQRLPLNDAEGKPTEKSLIELGFLPTFYQFQDTKIEVKMTISMQVESSMNLGLGGSIGNPNLPSNFTERGHTNTPAQPANGDDSDDPSGEDDEAPAAAPPTAAPSQTAVPYGAAVSIDYHHRFDFDQSGTSTVSTKLAAVPAPTAFLTALVQHSAGKLATDQNDDSDSDDGGS